jgi:hypothetical protein
MKNIIKDVFEKDTINFRKYEITANDVWSKSILKQLQDLLLNSKYYPFTVTDEHKFIKEKKLKKFRLNLESYELSYNINDLISYMTNGTGSPKTDNKKKYMVVPLHIRAKLSNDLKSVIEPEEIQYWGWGTWNSSSHKGFVERDLDELL